MCLEARLVRECRSFWRRATKLEFLFLAAVLTYCTLDLSTNKAPKSKMSSFSEWYSKEVSKQMADGTPPDAVHLDM